MDFAAREVVVASLHNETVDSTTDVFD